MIRETTSSENTDCRVGARVAKYPFSATGLSLQRRKINIERIARRLFNVFHLREL
jgi:hypothetical protein